MIIDEIFTRVVGTLLVVAILGIGGFLYRLWDRQRQQARQIRQLGRIVNSLVQSASEAQASTAYRIWVGGEYGRDDREEES